MSSPIVTARDGTEPFLSSCVPDLKLHDLTLQLHCSYFLQHRQMSTQTVERAVFQTTAVWPSHLTGHARTTDNATLVQYHGYAEPNDVRLACLQQGTAQNVEEQSADGLCSAHSSRTLLPRSFRQTACIYATNRLVYSFRAQADGKRAGRQVRTGSVDVSDPAALPPTGVLTAKIE